MMGLCPDCDGEGRVLVTFGALRSSHGRAARVVETIALRPCTVCGGAGWYDPAGGR